MDPTQSELGGKSVKKVDTTKEARTSASPQKAHGKKLVASTTALRLRSVTGLKADFIGTASGRYLLYLASMPCRPTYLRAVLSATVDVPI